MANVHLDPWDALTILHENTTGKPKKLLEQYLVVGAINPAQTLTDAWNALYERFGTGERIAASISHMLEVFPPIRNKKDHERLGDLLDLCRVVAVNIPFAVELQLYDIPSGIRQLWSKLPDCLQDNWMAVSHAHKEHHFGAPPKLTDFISYLDKKYSELSDPAYDKSACFQVKNKPRSTTTLKTDTFNDGASESASSDTSIETPQILDADICPLHPNAAHILRDCNAFKKMSYDDKRIHILKHEKCFICLGNHLKRNCKSNVSCDICKRRHLTLIHANFSNRDKENVQSKSSSSNPNHDKTEPSFNMCTTICGGNAAKSCSKVLLVDVTLPSKSNNKYRCYAILDE